MQIAEQKVPVIMEQIASLAQENEQTYIGLTDHICAGREILRNLREVELPEAKEEASVHGDFQTAQRVNVLKQTEETLEYQLTILEQARQGTVIGTSQLMDMDNAIRSNRMDSPERLQRAIDRLQAIETQLSAQATLNADMESTREEKRIELEQLTGRVLATISNNNTENNNALPDATEFTAIPASVEHNDKHYAQHPGLD